MHMIFPATRRDRHLAWTSLGLCVFIALVLVCGLFLRTGKAEKNAHAEVQRLNPANVVDDAQHAPGGIDAQVRSPEPVLAREVRTAVPAPGVAAMPGSMPGQDFAAEMRDLRHEFDNLRDELMLLSESVAELGRKRSSSRAERPVVGAGERSMSSAPQAVDGVHIVAAGETLGVIAGRYGLDAGCLSVWNRLRDPHLIYPGDRLRLSGAESCGGDSGSIGFVPGGRTYAPPHRTQSDWRIIGMGNAQVALRRGADRPRLFRVGEEVPGAGRILHIDPHTGQVRTTQRRFMQTH